MGRKKKPLARSMCVNLNIRLTKDTLLEVKRMAKKYGYWSASHYVRDAALGTLKDGKDQKLP